MKIKKYIAAIVSAYLFCASANAALPNESKEVTKIDITKTSVIFVIAGGSSNIVGAHEDCNQHGAVSCPTGEKYCDHMLSVGLAAKLAGKKVEFTLENNCHGSFPELGRFRMME